ncbi:cupin domain-containing protein [Phaeospirillum tilakii]|uniref:Cupin domain-containing protein n=1 Tax=Phaeospirillum tilakii TaxID=741673 RepID=A0ABW5C968_9PROT
MPKIDPNALPVLTGTSYPPPHDAPCAARRVQRLAAAGGLGQFGVNLVVLPPGSWSSQRHWHSAEEEFVYVLAGELTLVEDQGETLLRAGDAAAFPAGGNGHHLRNLSDAEARFLAIGSRIDADHGEYPDIDLAFEPDRYRQGPRYRRKDSGAG